MEASPATPDACRQRTASAPRLTWVVVGGALRRVAEFAHLPLGQRPSATCPHCTRAVALKLGPQVAHHAAHRPGDECAATGPETALHLNAKFHLAEQLRGGAPINLLASCASGVNCLASTTVPWPVLWDRVEVELPVGTRRPDITLLAGGRAVAAVEIFASHAVDPEKAAVLATLGLPWVEVRASAIIRDDGSMWEPTSPLQPHRSVPAEAWYCEPCTRRFADARWQQENGEFERHVRLVDFYFPNGKKFRDVFTVAERRGGGAVVATLLRRRGNGYQDVVPAPPSAATMSMLKQAFDRIIHSYSSRGAIVDSPMAWTPADEVIFTSNLVVYGDIHYPRRYRWSPKNQRWFLAREHASRRWDTDPDGGG